MRDQLTNEIKNGWINAVTSGIDNTGNTDATLKIIEIINNADPGSVIYFPKGIYLVSGNISISKPLTILGDSYYHPANSHFPMYDQTIFKVADYCENITIFTKSGQYNRIAIKNITMYSTSFVFNYTNYIPVSGSYGGQFSYTINKNNVNAIDIHNDSWGSLIENVFINGFSGVGIDGPCDSTYNNIYVSHSGTGMIIETDSTATNIRVQFCKNGAYIKNSCNVTNIRVEEIANVGITFNSYYTSVSNMTVDMCDYNGIVTEQLLYSTIQGTVMRCGLNYYNNNVANLPDIDKSKAAKIRNTGISYLNRFILNAKKSDGYRDNDLSLWQTYLFAFEADFQQTSIDFPHNIPYSYSSNTPNGLFNNLFGSLIYISSTTSPYVEIEFNTNQYRYVIKGKNIMQMGNLAIGQIGFIVPIYIGQMLLDISTTPNKLYVATSISLSGWMQINTSV